MQDSLSFQAALDVLRQLHHHGYAVAPMTPSRAMLEAGARASELSDSTLERVWRAMLQAAAEDLP